MCIRDSADPGGHRGSLGSARCVGSHSCRTMPNAAQQPYGWRQLALVIHMGSNRLDELQGCLTAYLTTAGRSKDFSDTWLRVWHELMPAEVIAYLQYQLRIHQFSDAFLEELAKLMVPNESRYSLGHWRYACWASVRSMASVSLQHPGNVELLKFTLATELPRRLQFAHGSQQGKLCFSPPHSIPMSCLLYTSRCV